MLAEKHELLQSSLNNQYSSNVHVQDGVEYNSEQHEIQDRTAISDFCKTNQLNVHFICKSVLFNGITYTTDMFICVRKNIYGNFILCKIKYILVNDDLSDISFLGNTDEITLIPELGFYEIAQYIGEENRSQSLAVFAYSSLLSPDPLPQAYIQSCPVFLLKHAPYDPQL